jgi:hypothetical protein
MTQFFCQAKRSHPSWQGIPVLDLLQVASWFLNHSHQISWHSKVTHIHYWLFVIAFGPSTQRQLTRNCPWDICGYPWDLVPPYGPAVTLGRIWSILVAVLQFLPLPVFSTLQLRALSQRKRAKWGRGSLREAKLENLVRPYQPIIFGQCTLNLFLPFQK